jgi:ubiquitin-conjugating enzyme E2 D/E
VNDDDIFNWRAFIKGPAGTPFEGGCFELAVRFPSEYPFKPPFLQFLTPIYHPNVTAEGRMSLDLTSFYWNPAVTLYQVLLHLLSVLEVPNPDNFLRSDIGQLQRNDLATYEANAREATRLHALDLRHFES